MTDDEPLARRAMTDDEPLARRAMTDDEPLARRAIADDEPLARRAIADRSTPWGTGLTVAAFVAAVTGAAIVVLSLGVSRVHPLLAVGLNLVAVGGLAPTLWGWRTVPVLRWFVLGGVVGVVVAWLALLAIAAQHV